ncbi:sodium:proton antiporter [Sulfurimonas aquatica]|uniref:Sodium:proton antiporter n=1 Tax=Sulfurimonas aquatica TaxID=2672570 RepID=A0A975AYU0_9BACT|nr:Na+/H+ antiporter NhaC family protein [Sulfurimonas aquatica]QSZ41023.1 sodium:proton antiporter [Sulfurimonas aquatica]
MSTLEAAYELYLTILTTGWILNTLAFVVLLGSIMAVIEKSGGVGGFVDFALHKKPFVKSKRSALLLSYIIGVVVFIETSITALVSGAVGKPFCDKYKIPYAKLAYVCDSTAAPIGSLIVINGYGALLLGLISTQIDNGVLTGNALDILLDSIVFNFYAISALIVTFLVIWFSIDIGPMKYAKYSKGHSIKNNKINSMYLMLLPIFIMLIFIFVFLYITGDGNILNGSGSNSILYTVLTTLFFTLFYYVATKNMTPSVWLKISLHGAKRFFAIAMILIFAFSIGNVTVELKTGEYLASLANENLNVIFLAGTIFLLGSIISFSTGTSWGTFSIMIPIAIPMAVGMDANIALCIGAVISGGIFGDHCSPISDTTIISSMAADCDVVEHVKTQLPYALVSGAIAFSLFIGLSII